MNTELYQHQLDALQRMHNGCILCGGVGSGKSRTSLAYTYVCELGGSLKINNVGVFSKPETPKDLYIITTAKKRDSLEWEGELAYFCLLTDDVINVTIDSWNNLHKYKNVLNAMFIFDEQRLVGSGAWVKTFLKIVKGNHWILLSATPGDSYSEYIPVLIANGFYRSRSQFKQEHVVYKPYLKFPSIDHYVNTNRLDYYISKILVKMKYENSRERHYIEVMCTYDRDKYKKVMKDRWDPFENCPIEETSKLCYLLRRVSNEDKSRFEEMEKIIYKRNRLIVFYNFTYELLLLREFFEKHGYSIGEWNGQCHTEIPKSNKWVYLCQYTAACEGWSCIETDSIIFFSQNYSYKVFEQASGRIDRLTTKYKDLYYFCLRCPSPIDIAIKRALKLKRNFNEKIFMKGVEFNCD